MSPRICVCPFLSLCCVSSTSRLNVFVLEQRLYLYCEDFVTLVQSFVLWPVRPLGSNLALESLMPWGTASHLEWLPTKLLTLFPFLVQISMPVLYSGDQNSWGQKIRRYASIFKKIRGHMLFITSPGECVYKHTQLCSFLKVLPSIEVL